MTIELSPHGVRQALTVTLTLLWLCPQAQAAIDPAPIHASALTAARAPYDVFAAVDTLDRRAHAARRSDDAGEEEAALDDALKAAWKSIVLPADGVVRVDEPLSLAMLALHVEVRRSLGPDFVTLVPGLEKDPGCVGDVVGERMIAAYGVVATDVYAPLGASHDLLSAFALQIACLGDAQLALLDDALGHGFAWVADSLESNGLGELEPLFARLVAPLQVLVLDARKHAGEGSAAWQWFAQHGAELTRDVTVAGWPTGEILLWNRTTGRLKGFEPCDADSPVRGCVDLATFLDSLRDPRALGAGQCALSGMVAKGTEPVGGADRYTCPTRTCTNEKDAQDPGSPSDGRPFEGVERTWPSASDQDQEEMKQLCTPSGSDLQGPPPAAGTCSTGDAGPGTDSGPFDRWLACMDQGGSTAEAPLSEPLRGVPSGNDCRLAADGDSTGNKIRAFERKAYKWGRRAHEARHVLIRWTDEKFFLESKTSENGVQVKIEPRGKTPRRAAIVVATHVMRAKSKDKKQTVGTRRHALAVVNQLQAEFHKAEPEASDPEPSPPGPTPLSRDPDLHTPPADCPEPGMCGNSCTALGGQLGVHERCTDDLLGGLAEAAGLGSREIDARLTPVGDLGRPLPEQGPDVEAADYGACLVDPVAVGEPTGCAVVMCFDGMLASGFGGGECGCGDVRFEFTPERIFCTDHRCPDGSAPNGSCGCTAGDAMPDQPGGGQPDPMGGVLIIDDPGVDLGTDLGGLSSADEPLDGRNILGDPLGNTGELR